VFISKRLSLSKIARSLALSSLLAGAAQAQQKPLFFDAEMVTVTPAADFVVDTYIQIKLGTTPVLIVRDSKSAKDFRGNDFQIRLFRLGLSDKYPSPWHTIGDCDIYLSWVVPIAGSDALTINLLEFSDDRWLAPSSDDMGRGSYLLVFERSKDKSTFFRLRRGHKESYFDFAVRMEILPARQYRREEVAHVGELLERMRTDLKTEAEENSSKSPCYRHSAVRVSTAAEPAVVMVFEACDEMS